jgi:hypothetical protein
MDGLDNEAMAELIIAVLVAMSEQLDLQRLVEALRRQHDVYAGYGEPGAQAVAQQLRRAGSALMQADALRQKRRGPQH